MKTEFEKKLKEHSFSYQCNTNGFYILSQNNDTNSILNVQLILSEPIEEVIHLSNNGNEIQTNACFKLKCLNEDKELYFLILAFRNTSNHCLEYIIIPPKELIKRIIEGNRISNVNEEIEIVFWLMADRFLYDCTNVGVEWEWYYLSKGLNGRMADGTDWDYSEYLNSWDSLKMI